MRSWPPGRRHQEPGVWEDESPTSRGYERPDERSHARMSAVCQLRRSKADICEPAVPRGPIGIGDWTPLEVGAPLRTRCEPIEFDGLTPGLGDRKVEAPPLRGSRRCGPPFYGGQQRRTDRVTDRMEPVPPGTASRRPQQMAPRSGWVSSGRVRSHRYHRPPAAHQGSPLRPRNSDVRSPWRVDPHRHGVPDARRVGAPHERAHRSRGRAAKPRDWHAQSAGLPNGVTPWPSGTVSAGCSRHPNDQPRAVPGRRPGTGSQPSRCLSWWRSRPSRS